MSKETNWKKFISDSGRYLLPNYFGLFGIPLDYTEQSLEKVDEFINVTYPLGNKPHESEFIPFGILLGETIIRNIPNTEWKIVSDKFSEIRVYMTAKNGVKWYASPFQRIKSYWYNRKLSLASLYRMMKFLSEVDIDKEDFLEKMVDSDGWINFPNGDKIKLTSIT